MRILFTGASSFSGFWFARALAEAGHTVVAPLLRKRADYVEPPRAARVEALSATVEFVEECPFGSSAFLALCASQPFDVLCHHAARLKDYKSPDFDVALAVTENTLNFRAILAAMKQLRGVVLSGSVFEANESAGSPPLVAFSPYGVSKGVTSQILEYHCEQARVPFGKFVIPNPFGPYEEPARFARHVIEQWKKHAVATVQTPHYVRDNIPIDLLAGSYAAYVSAMGQGPAPARLYPSGYVETQGAFAQRMAQEIKARSNLACELSLAESHAFTEPFARFNTMPATQIVPGWDEAASWDGLARYHQL